MINPSDSRAWPRGKAHDLCINKFPRMENISIPREIAERLDLPIPSKLVYGMLHYWQGRWARLRLYEVAGVIGITPDTARKHLRILEKEGLIERRQRVLRSSKGSGMATITHYRTRPVPKRPRGSKQPVAMRSPLDKFDQQFEEFFNEVDLDS